MAQHRRLPWARHTWRPLQRALLAGWLLAAGAAWAAELNTATEAELDGVRGLGPATTRALLAERERAPFTDWADLMRRVKGIRAERAARLSEAGLSVNGQAYTGPRPGASFSSPQE